MKRYLGVTVRKILGFFPYVKFLEKNYRNMLVLEKELGHMPGHYYSTIPSVDDVDKNDRRDYAKELVLDIDLNLTKQFDFLSQLHKSYSLVPYDFNNNKNEKYRYTLENAQYRYSDVIFLFLLITHFKPKRIIEVGSGHSSSVMLDANEFFMKNSIKLTFIEPYPENRLLKLLKPEDAVKCKVMKSFVQDIDTKLYDELEENDILFIDSSHVSKIGSDLNHIIFNILPRLKKGVIIHFHDIFYPFELPKQWIKERKWYWNENYLLRSFLMNNKSYEILLFNSLLHVEYKNWFVENMPNCLIGSGETGSIWLRKND